MKHNAQKTGFTLIELMVVITLLGIVAGIAMPAFINQNIRAKTSALIAAAGPAQAYLGNYYASTLNIASISCSYASCSGTNTLNVTNPDFLNITSPQVNAINIVNGNIGVYGNASGFAGMSINLYFLPITTTGRLDWRCATDTNGCSATNRNLIPSNCLFSINSAGAAC